MASTAQLVGLGNERTRKDHCSRGGKCDKRHLMGERDADRARLGSRDYPKKLVDLRLEALDRLKRGCRAGPKKLSKNSHG